MVAPTVVCFCSGREDMESSPTENKVSPPNIYANPERVRRLDTPLARENLTP